MSIQRKNYPFTAIVGQEKMKLALILNLIDPTIGGVLIKGEKGTAKSTAVRGVADLLPNRDQVDGCRFSCDPYEIEKQCENCREKYDNGSISIINSVMKVVNLPVSATEDRVVGTLDIEHALKVGEKKFESGILADANRNILYVDEVNLLEDHVVDILLDSAAMGVNVIEREGISYTHPSRFVLVGTMNPEEGDLRPQLLDRFGLVVEVEGENDINSRVEVVKRRLDFEKDPQGFSAEYERENKFLQDKINKAKEMISRVSYDDEILELIANISISVGVDGHRADIAMLKAAMSYAAYCGREAICEEDIKTIAPLVLYHRMRRRPFDTNDVSLAHIEEIIKSIGA